MAISGVVMNGRVEFTEAANLPDGTEVIVDVLRPRDEDEETREEFLQSWRESIAAGTSDCIPADEFLAQWRMEIDERERAADYPIHISDATTPADLR